MRVPTYLKMTAWALAMMHLVTQWMLKDPILTTGAVKEAAATIVTKTVVVLAVAATTATKKAAAKEVEATTVTKKVEVKKVVVKEVEVK